MLSEIWFILNLTGLFAGFALLLVILVLYRIKPFVGARPALEVLAGYFLIAGFLFLVSFRGVVDRTPTVFGDILLGCAAGFALFAQTRFVGRFLRWPRVRQRLRIMLTGAILVPGIWFLAVGLRGFRAFPFDHGLYMWASFLLHLTIAGYGVLSALAAFSCARRLPDSPWGKFFRGFGTAIVILAVAHVPNWLVVTIAFPEVRIARADLVFVVGYIVANIRILAGVIGTVHEDHALHSHVKPEPSFVTRFGLTRREQEIVEHIFEGKTNAAIAEELFIAVRTVDTHVVNIFRKCGVNSRYELFRLIVQRPLRSST